MIHTVQDVSPAKGPEYKSKKKEEKHQWKAWRRGGGGSVLYST